MRYLVEFLRNEDAATAVEYAVMLALIIVTIAGAIGAFGSTTGGMWGGINNELKTVGFVK